MTLDENPFWALSSRVRLISESQLCVEGGNFQAENEKLFQMGLHISKNWKLVQPTSRNFLLLSIFWNSVPGVYK